MGSLYVVKFNKKISRVIVQLSCYFGQILRHEWGISRQKYEVYNSLSYHQSLYQLSPRLEYSYAWACRDNISALTTVCTHTFLTH
jgi:hypothetical protein